MLSLVAGSLPPSPADSGVSDVDSSSSGHTSNDELKARLQLTPGQCCVSFDLITQQESRSIKTARAGALTGRV
jgi:hypothetical protein